MKFGDFSKPSFPQPSGLPSINSLPPTQQPSPFGGVQPSASGSRPQTLEEKIRESRARRNATKMPREPSNAIQRRLMEEAKAREKAVKLAAEKEKFSQKELAPENVLYYAEFGGVSHQLSDEALQAPLPSSLSQGSVGVNLGGNPVYSQIYKLFATKTMLMGKTGSKADFLGQMLSLIRGSTETAKKNYDTQATKRAMLEERGDSNPEAYMRLRLLSDLIKKMKEVGDRIQAALVAARGSNLPPAWA